MQGLLLVAIAGLTARAHAEVSEDARSLYMAGRQAYQAGRYDVAIESFEAANKIAPAPLMYFNLAQAYRKLFLSNEDPEALRHALEDYRRFLREAPTTGDAGNRAAAIQALGELLPLESARAQAATPGVVIAPPPARTELMIVTEVEHAKVVLDGGAPAPAPLLATVTPGEHHAHIEAPGWFPGELKLTAVEGRLIVGEGRLSPQPGHVEVASEAGAQLYIDGQHRGALPLALELPARGYTLTVIARGREPWSGAVEVTRGETAKVSAPLRVTGQRRAAKWIAGVAAAAVVLTAAESLVWLQADSAASSIDATRTSSTITPAQLDAYEADGARRDTWRSGTLGTLAVTAAFALLAGALYLFDVPAAP